MKQSQKINEAKKQLAKFYAKEGPEHCGFIKTTDHSYEIVEVKNIAQNPAEGFEITAADIIAHTESPGCWATWHTHPACDCNLSGKDYVMFKAWSNLYHFIVGNDGVKCYYFDKDRKAVLECC